MTGHIMLEVCVDGAAGLEAAVAGGADRVELCSALELGGLTPSVGLMRVAATMSVPVYAMIRPRAGDFVFGPGAVAVMCRDIEAARDAGLAGVVLGASLADGRLDEGMLALLCRHAKGLHLGLTLHRAFDLVPEPLPALETAVALGFDRVLTSGLAATASEGLDTLAALAEAAAGRIAIMPGGGVGSDTAGAILARTGTREVHSSCSVPQPAPSPAAVAFGFASATARSTDRETVAALRRTLDGLGSGATG